MSDDDCSSDRKRQRRHLAGAGVSDPNTFRAVRLALTQRAQTSLGEIAFDVSGDGSPVVLVHGTPSRAAVWRQVVPTLADTHRVFVFDLLGFGDSERRLDQDVSIAAHGRVLRELVELWGLVDPAVVGHDIGGATAVRAPDRRRAVCEDRSD